MVSALTKNAIDHMVNNINEPNEEYVIQVLIAPQFVADSLFKFTFSDGFARTKKGYLVSDAAQRQEEIKDLSILKVKKFINTDNSVDRERIIVATFELLYSNVTDLIGKPIEYKNYKNCGMQNPEGSIVIPEKYQSRNAANKNAAASGQSRQPPSAFNNYNNNNNGGNQQKPAGNNPYGHNKVTQNPQSMYGQNSPNQQQQQRSPAGMPSASMDDERDLERITSLTPHQEAAFKARVTKKGDMKNFHSAKGDGTLFSVDVIDAHGSETTLSFFNQEATKYFSYLQVEQVYIFKNGVIKPNTNRTFNKGDVVVTMTKDSQILAAQDDGKIPFMTMNRKRIGEIQSLEKDKNIDIIGFVRENSEVRVVTLKDSNQKQRRDIKVFDESRIEIEISLWGEKADRVNACEGDLIVIKDARVGEYRDKKQVNLGYNTQIFLNPDFAKFPEALLVQQWRENNDLSGLISEFQSKSPAFGNGGSSENPAGMNVPAMNWESSIMQLREEINTARLNNMFSDEFKIWREVRALVHFVKDSPLYYDSCEKCKKKVKLDVDRWFCENCQTSSDQPTSRYIATVLIADSTDQIWVSVFDEVAKKIFGHSANEFRLLGENNTEEKKKKLQQVHYKEFRFLLLTRSERDPSTGQYRDKTIIHGIKDDQPCYESKRLLNSLEKYIQLE